MDEAALANKVTIEVEGLPPAKGEAFSAFNPTHPHAHRVRALLEAAARQLPVGFEPLRTVIGLDVTVRAGMGTAWDATNYLGGIADALQSKQRHGDLMQVVQVLGPDPQEPRRYVHLLECGHQVGHGLLKEKRRRCDFHPALPHLGELARVAVYLDDRQIREVHYREEQATTASYTVRVWTLSDSASSRPPRLAAP